MWKDIMEKARALMTRGRLKKLGWYAALAALSRKAKSITEAVQHTLELGELDCASCKMKPICDEVDGLRELHLKREKENRNHGT